MIGANCRTNYSTPNELGLDSADAVKIIYGRANEVTNQLGSMQMIFILRMDWMPSVPTRNDSQYSKSGIRMRIPWLGLESLQIAKLCLIWLCSVILYCPDRSSNSSVSFGKSSLANASDFLIKWWMQINCWKESAMSFIWVQKLAWFRNYLIHWCDSSKSLLRGKAAGLLLPVSDTNLQR